MNAVVITLPAVLDLNAALALKNDIQARAGAPLDLDAAHVERLGGLCAQILIAAAQSWRGAGVALRVVNASAAFCDDARLLGAANLILPGDGASAC